MTDLAEQLVKYLTDVHAIEQQALAQMRVSPELAGHPQLADAFSEHCRETVEHERAIRGRLEEHDAKPAVIKDLLGTLTGKGFTAFARVQPDTPGKLTAHAFSYEHMELAAYVMLGRVATLAGDEATAEEARRICAEEQAMGERLASCFDCAVDVSLDGTGEGDLEDRLSHYLADAHAIERQSLALLDRAPRLAGTEPLAGIYADHRRETEAQLEQVDERLNALGAEPSRIKDAALRLGGINWGLFFGAQPDTPAKLAAFAYAFEHLEIASYELLRRVALRAGDEQTAELASRHATEERSAAEQIRGQFDAALDASLRLVTDVPRAGAA